jgi:hypothetical protein
VNSDRTRPVGSSGVFKAIVLSARKLKRAFSEGDDELPAGVEDFVTTVAQAFMNDRIDEVHALSTIALQERTSRDSFVERWRQAIAERGGVDAFEISNAGAIDLEYIPGLESVPQEQFVAFAELAFGTTAIPLDHEKVFTVGVIVLIVDSHLRVGAIHAR